MSNDNDLPPDLPFTITEPGKPPRPTRVAICVPSFDTWKADMSMALVGLGTYTMTQGAIVQAFMNEKSSMVTKARNSLAEKALNFGADAILFIDSDLVFPADALVRLLRHNLDIVGATYNKRVPPYETLGHFLGAPRDLSAGGLVEADYLPGGFLLIRTSVLKGIPKPWFFETYYRSPESAMESFLGLADDQYSEAPPPELRKAVAEVPGLQEWLQSQRDDKVEFDAGYMSEDYNFCRKARKAGHRIWCDLDLTYSLSHVGERAVRCERPQPAATQNIDLSAA